MIWLLTYAITHFPLDYMFCHRFYRPIGPLCTDGNDLTLIIQIRLLFDTFATCTVILSKFALFYNILEFDNYGKENI